MSDVTEPTVTLGTPTPAAPPAVSYPDDYEELRGYRDRFTNLASTLEPVVDDIRPILEDEEYREFIRTAKKSWDATRAAREPEIDPSLAPVVDRFEKRLGPIVEYLDGEKQAREREAQQRIASAQQANLDYAKRLAAERPELARDDYAGIGMLAAYAANRNISLEEAYKRVGDTFAKAAPAREKPPTSLRGEAAAPGVPGESTNPPIKSSVDLRKRLAANLRAAGMKG